jgi:hypothetical protein
MKDTVRFRKRVIKTAWFAGNEYGAMILFPNRSRRRRLGQQNFLAGTFETRFERAFLFFNSKVLARSEANLLTFCELFRTEVSQAEKEVKASKIVQRHEIVKRRT